MSDDRWPSTGGKIYPEFADGGRHCPEHGHICHMHAKIDGRLIQILVDRSGELSPEHYTIGYLHRRLDRLQAELSRFEHDLDRVQRERDMDRESLKAYRLAARTGKPLRDCLLAADALEPDFLVYFNEDGTVRETAPWAGLDAA